MSEFWAMGGYGAYVWIAYGVTALALVLLFAWSWFGARARDAELEQIRKLSRAERRTPSSATSSTDRAKIDRAKAEAVAGGNAPLGVGHSGTVGDSGGAS